MTDQSEAKQYGFDASFPLLSFIPCSKVCTIQTTETGPGPNLGKQSPSGNRWSFEGVCEKYAREVTSVFSSRTQKYFHQ